MATDRIMREEAGGPIAKLLKKITITPNWIAENIRNLRYPSYANAVADALIDPNSAARITNLKQLPLSVKKAIQTGMLLNTIYLEKELRKPNRVPLSTTSGEEG